MTSSKEINNKSVRWSVETHMPIISHNSKFLYLSQYNFRKTVVLKEHFGQSKNFLVMMHIKCILMRKLQSAYCDLKFTFKSLGYQKPSV